MSTPNDAAVARALRRLAPCGDAFSGLFQGAAALPCGALRPRFG